MSASTEIKGAAARGDWDAFDAIVARRRADRMNKIDALDAGLRACVHDYGFNAVNAFLQLGIKKPRHIRHLVETVLNEFSPTRGSTSNQGVRRAPGLSAE